MCVNWIRFAVQTVKHQFGYRFGSLNTVKLDSKWFILCYLQHKNNNLIKLTFVMSGQANLVWSLKNNSEDSFLNRSDLKINPICLQSEHSLIYTHTHVHTYLHSQVHTPGALKPPITPRSLLDSSAAVQIFSFVFLVTWRIKKNNNSVFFFSLYKKKLFFLL